MREIGLSGGIIDPKHYQAMGLAFWLYVFLIQQTPIRTAWVRKGRPVSTREMARAIGAPQPTVRRWLDRLEEYGYIVTARDRLGIRVGITKRKWFKGGVPILEMVGHGEPLAAHPRAASGSPLSHQRLTYVGKTVVASTDRLSPHIDDPISTSHRTSVSLASLASQKCALASRRAVGGDR